MIIIAKNVIATVYNIYYNKSVNKDSILAYNINKFKGGLHMATSSITKEFVIRDSKVYEQLVNDLEKQAPKPISTSTASSLKRGKEKLAQLSYR